MKILKISLITILALAILYVAAIYTLEFYIEKQLKKEKQLTFKEFNMSFGGDLTFKNLKFKNEMLDVQVKDIKLNIGLMEIITSDTILIEKATIKNVHLNYFKQASDSTNVAETKVKKSKKKKRAFALHKVSITGLDFYSIQEEDTLTRVIDVNLEVKLKDIKNIQFRQLEKLTFKYLRQNAGVLNDVTIDHFNYNNHTIAIDTFRMFTRYSKANYIHYIPQRKGHIDMIATKLILDSVDFKIQKNKLQKISLNDINLEAFALDVYRDKTIPEYTKHEPTYAEIFQSLDFELEANSLITQNSRVSFSMKSMDGKVSRIDLKDIEAKLTHINNIPAKKEIMNLTGNFALSSNSNIGVYLAYNQYANAETFQLDVHGRNIDTKALNTMLRPAMNTQISGTVDEIDVHMVSYGSGAGTVRLQSNDLKVILYKKNGKKRKLFTFIGNLLLHKPLDKTGKVKDFEFDQTRPVWNYIWHFIQEGLKKAVL